MPFHAGNPYPCSIIIPFQTRVGPSFPIERITPPVSPEKGMRRAMLPKDEVLGVVSPQICLS